MKLFNKIIIPTMMASIAVGFVRYQYSANDVVIDYSAFKNLSANINELTKSSIERENGPENQITKFIIDSIDKDLSKKIGINKREIKNQITKIKPIKKIVIDEVRIASSSTEEEKVVGPIEPVIDSIGPVESEKEMTMYEYSPSVNLEKPNEVTKKLVTLYDREISDTVKAAISRVVSSGPPRAELLEKVNKEEDQIIYNYAPREAKPIKPKKDKGFSSPILNTIYKIQAVKMELDKGLNQTLSSFDFMPDYNKEDRIDATDSAILIKQDITDGLNTQTGIVEAAGMMSTRIEVHLNTQSSMVVPMLTEEAAEKMYPGQNLILLAVNSSVSDVEIDSSYMEKILLDRNAKKTTVDSEVKFVLFAGVKSGNILLKYLLSNKEIAQKIIYVGEREMYFEEANFTDGGRELYSFSTQNFMSTKKTDLSISPDLIFVFNTGINAKKHTLSSYELKMPAMISGSRKYVELKHLSDSVFVGTDSKFEIEIPSNEFIVKVLQENQINSIKEKCIVQVNLSKDLSNLTVNGKNHQGEMYTEVLALDEDGAFSKTEFESAEKVFILGDMEGMFNAKLEYSDGSSQFLKTFCSTGTYIVEQL